MGRNEIVDVLNEDGAVVGKMLRENAELENHLTENVLILIFNSQGKVWAQLRSKTKKYYPGRWDISACGGIVSGETPEQAALRETEEEMGFVVALRHVESFINVFPGESGQQLKRLSHLFVGVSDLKPLVNDDVDEFKIWQPDELRKDVIENSDSYVPSFVVELDKAIEGLRERSNCGKSRT